MRVDLCIDYGDQLAYRRMLEAWEKIEGHRKRAEAFEMDAKTYGSQPVKRTYDLDASDVLHYRLSGGSREE